MDWIKEGRDIEHFSGIIYILNNKGEKISKINTVDGTQINKRDSSSKTVCYYELEKIQKFCVGPYCTTTYYYKEVCTSGNSGDGSNGGSTDGGPGDPASIPSVPIDGDDNDWDTGGGNGDGGVITPTMPDEEMTFEVHRDTSFIEIDKINCTYEKLIQGSSIADILIDFFGEDALSNVTFNVVEDLNCNGNNNATGCTTPLAQNNYRIDIDKDYINDPSTPTIFLAQTLVHEAIHANLYAAVKKLNNGIPPTDPSFEALYEDYRQLQDWQHEYMADHYTGIMQEAIREVHLNLNDDQFLNNYDNNTLWDWDAFYEYISYRGLDRTEAGEEYFDNAENISLYQDDTKTNSTKKPNCN
ncbi:hypothetical protein [Zunongwangia profunda]|uniref:hypothetical protein n=2 Tax=Zunongwangia profunda TaxID=398743 RepID=UPI001D18323C|nr:hypothetical protein [Zunongwangia profunda]MCC4226715.1 hypothetical protein [Zunongwangia profunda]